MPAETMPTTFERTPEVKEKIDTIRAIPEKEARLEALREFRLETAFNEAHFMEETLEIVEKNPEISHEELVAQLKSSNVIVHPEKVDSYVSAVERTCFTVKSALGRVSDGWVINKYLRRKADFAENPMVQIVSPREFQDLAKGTAPVAMLLEDTHLAIGLKANDRGYALLNSPDGSGGFASFDGSLSYIKEPNLIGSVCAPLVVTNTNSASLIHHEIGHNNISILKSSLRGPHLDSLWGITHFDNDAFSNFMNDYSHISVEGILELSESTRAEITQILNSIKGYVLACVKGELLADYALSPLGGTFQYLNTVVSHDLYDYLENALLIPKTSAVYKLIRYGSANGNFEFEGYEGVLKKNVAVAEKVTTGYKKLPDPTRYRLFRNVLMRIPIDQWESYLTENKFVEESEEIVTFIQNLEDVQDALRKENFDFLINAGVAYEEVIRYMGPERYSAVQDGIDKWEELKATFKTHASDYSFMGNVLKELSAELDTLKDHFYENLPKDNNARDYTEAFERTLAKYPEEDRINLRFRLIEALNAGGHSFYVVLTLFDERHRYQITH